MRILFLAPQPFFEVRGTPLAILAMVRALGSLGHQVDLLTFPQGEDIAVSGVRHGRSLSLPVGRVKPGASFAKMALDVPFVAQAAWRLRRGVYDVVHAVEEAAHLMAPLTEARGVPLVVDVDSSIPQQLRYSGFARRGPLPWLAERLEHFALRRAVAAITVCRSLTAIVRAVAPATPVFQIEDPPLVDGPSADTAAVAALRARLGLGSQPVVLYTGNFEKYQGVDLLVAAARAVPGVSFVVVGGRNDEVATLRSLLSAAGLGDRFVLTGARPPGELPLYLGLADVLVSPRTEGTNTPFKIYTYMASGKAIVATSIESHTQVLSDETAFLAQPTAESLAARIREAALHPAASAAKAAAARGLLDREYSAERHFEKVKVAYEAIGRLVTQPRRRRG